MAGRLGQLAEQMRRNVRCAPDRCDTTYEFALLFLREGRLNRGGTWRAGPPPLQPTLGDAEACVLQRLQQVVRDARPAGDEGQQHGFEARFRVAPSRAGGAGIGIEGAAVETFLSHTSEGVADEGRVLQRLGAAMRTVAEEQEAALGQAVRRALEGDLVWRLVGWRQRDAWDLVDVSVTRLALGDPMIDRRRGAQWPANRSEVWIPFTVDVVATLRRRT